MAHWRYSEFRNIGLVAGCWIARRPYDLTSLDYAVYLRDDFQVILGSFESQAEAEDWARRMPFPEPQRAALIRWAKENIRRYQWPTGISNETENGSPT